MAISSILLKEQTYVIVYMLFAICRHASLIIIYGTLYVIVQTTNIPIKTDPFKQNKQTKKVTHPSFPLVV